MHFCTRENRTCALSDTVTMLTLDSTTSEESAWTNALLRIACTFVANSSLVMSSEMEKETCPEERSCSTLSKQPCAALRSKHVSLTSEMDYWKFNHSSNQVTMIWNTRKFQAKFFFSSSRSRISFAPWTCALQAKQRIVQWCDIWEKHQKTNLRNRSLSSSWSCISMHETIGGVQASAGVLNHTGILISFSLQGLGTLFGRRIIILSLRCTIMERKKLKHLVHLAFYWNEFISRTAQTKYITKIITIHIRANCDHTSILIQSQHSNLKCAASHSWKCQQAEVCLGLDVMHCVWGIVSTRYCHTR